MNQATKLVDQALVSAQTIQHDGAQAPALAAVGRALVKTNQTDQAMRIAEQALARARVAGRGSS
jgi:hypothetical protein